mgnify:CR=1 FL=1
MINQYDTLVDATNNLRKQGFAAQFEFGEQCIRDTDTGKKYGADDLKIIEYHRFEGNTNPSDMSIIYALQAKDGVKGTIIAPYGTYANPDLMELLKQIEIRPEENE